MELCSLQRLCVLLEDDPLPKIALHSLDFLEALVIQPPDPNGRGLARRNVVDR